MAPAADESEDVGMNPERWRRIEQVYNAALDLESGRQEAYLAEACAGDESLREEVEALLREGSGSREIMKTPALEFAARALTEEPGARPSVDPIGRSVGRYRIVEKIGEGGMGEVFLADDTSLHRKVALKFLPPDLQQDVASHKRFIREAHSAAALNHPYICSIYEVGNFEGKDFISMEYVDGQMLADRLAKGPLPLKEALRIATEVAEALEEAHEKRIIHRDLKPANIMLTRKGHAKVMDFGLAKQLVPPGGIEGQEESDTALTRSGMTLGTLAYMSPEQLRGEIVDARSDIFSFGIVLYEMLAGVNPFKKATGMDTASAILKDAPRSLAELRPDAPVLLQHIVKKTLAKDLHDRFSSIHDVIIDLREPLEKPDQPVMHAARRRALVWAAVAVAILIAGSLAAWRLLRTSPQDLPEPTVVPLTSYPGSEIQPSFSPDGTEVVFSWNRPEVGNFDIYRKLIGSGEPLRLTNNPANDYYPVWSPDGRFIAFGRLAGPKSEVLMIPALGGQESKLGEVTTPYQMRGPFIAWTPDSAAVVIVDRDPPSAPSSLFLLSVENRERHRLTSPPTGAHGDTGMSFSPDGRHLVFIRATSTMVEDGLYVLALSRGFSPQEEIRRLTGEVMESACPVWTPDGREIIFWSDRGGQGRLWRLSAFGDDPPRPLAIAGDVLPLFALSRQGTRLAYEVGSEVGRGDTDIWSLDISGPANKVRAPVRIISSSRRDELPRLSPDGKKIAFESTRSGGREIWVTASDGANPVQLTPSGGTSGTPRWSPDSERIVFDLVLAGNTDIYVTSLGGGKPIRLTTDPGEDVTPSWSHDGKLIYFCSNRTGERQVWKIPAAGGEAVQVTKKGGMAPLESTDGRHLYYSKGDSNTSVWRVPVTGGEEIQIVDSLIGWWDFDVVEDGIYFITPSALGERKLLFRGFADGKIQTVASFNQAVGGLSISQDRRKLIISLVENLGSDLMLVENFR